MTPKKTTEQLQFELDAAKADEKLECYPMRGELTANELVAVIVALRSELDSLKSAKPAMTNPQPVIRPDGSIAGYSEGRKQ